MKKEAPVVQFVVLFQNLAKDPRKMEKVSSRTTRLLVKR
jgi:hypothetical protein